MLFLLLKFKNKIVNKIMDMNEFTYHIDPFLKPSNESHPGHFETLLTATTAAE